MITGGDGLFAKANDAATKYNQAAQNEADMLNQLLNSNYLSNGGNDGDDPATVVTTTDSYVGYYADIDTDGTVDGIIFADLAVGGSGKWGEEDGEYTIPVKTGLKEYYISQTEHKGDFGTKDVLSLKAGTTGEERFYVMALENFEDCIGYYWYYNAYDRWTEGNMTDYATATSVEFGKGRDNTDTMIDYWNEGKYGAKHSWDMWGAIQGKVEAGWFVPSRAEWAAFADELGITEEDYANYRLDDVYPSSSQFDADVAWHAGLYVGYAYGVNVRADGGGIRLATTF